MKFSSPRIIDQHLLNHELEAAEPTGMEYIYIYTPFRLVLLLLANVCSCDIVMKLLTLQKSYETM